VKDHAILHSYLALVQLLEQAFTSDDVYHVFVDDVDVFVYDVLKSCL